MKIEKLKVFAIFFLGAMICFSTIFILVKKQLFFDNDQNISSATPHSKSVPYDKIGITQWANQQISDAKFSIEVHRLANEQDAIKLVAQLNNQGFAAYYTPVQTGGEITFIIRIGIYSDRDSALKELARTRSMGHKGAIVRL